MTGRAEIRLLSSLAVRVDGALRPLPKSRKVRALLALLALEPQPHHRSTLCSWLWPEAADPRAELRWALSKLRDVLADEPGSLLVATRDTVALDWRRVETDRAQLEALLQSGEQADLESLLDFEQRFERALLADVASSASPEMELWLEAQRLSCQHLHERLLVALIDRMYGEPAAAVEFATRLVTLDPLNVAANARLLTLTHATRGRSEARHALERMRKRLLDAGCPDSELLAAWRQLSGSSTGSGGLAPDAPAPEPEEERLLALPEKPSVAVLSFRDLGGHRSGEILAEGLAVDLTSRLAQLKGLLVIARASARRFSLATHDSNSIGRRLGVRYLIDGTSQRTDTQLRVTVALIEAEHGWEIWSEQFDRPLGELFAVQDDIANAMVSAIEPQINQAEMERVRSLPTENLTAWECFHRAMWHSFRFTDEGNQLAHELFRRALAQDPQFARAYAGLSFNHFSRAFLDASDDVAGDIRKALELAEQSVSLDGRDALGHWALGRARFLHREHEQALAAIDRALIANPNFAQGHYAHGFVALHADAPEPALADLDMAHRLSPFDPLLFAIKASRGLSLAVQGHYRDAAEWAVRATQEPNAHFHIHAIAAACQQLAGRRDAAARSVARTLELHPRYSIAVFERSLPYKDPGQGRRFARALLEAGLAAE